MTCDLCPDPAVVFAPGSAPVRGGPILLSREIPLRCWCLDCAKGAGWPWLRSYGVAEARAREAAGRSGATE